MQIRLLSSSLILSILSILSKPSSAASVLESARKIPVAYQVDVVVVGGSTGAVSAAVAAAKAGAKVFLAAPRPYLGEDMAGSLRLWLEEGEEPASPLAKRLYTDSSAMRQPLDPNSIPFKYEADVPSGGVHKDTRPPSLLADGVWGDAATESVQYPGDVTITLDLLQEQDLKGARLMAYHRGPGEAKADFNVESVAVSASLDKKEWTQAAVVKNEKPVPGCVVLSAPFVGKARYLRLDVKKAAAAKRILLGEIVVLKAGLPAPAPARPPRGPVTPLHVKRTLDEALLGAGVQFLFSCYATDVIRDAAGDPCGIVMANRSGRQAVVAKVIIDATDRAWVARMAGAKFQPFPAGPQTVTRVVVGGEPLTGEALKARKITPPFEAKLPAKGAASSRAYDIIEYTLQIPMKDGRYASWAEAEQIARDMTYHPQQQFTSNTLFQVPPDPVHSESGVRASARIPPERPEGRTPNEEPPKGGTTNVELGACRPAGVPRLFVLGGCADVPRDHAAKLLRPLALIDLGERIGAAAAAEAKALPAPKDPRLVARATDQTEPRPPKGGTPNEEPPKGGTPNGDVRESLGGLRPAENAPTIPQEERALPVLGTYDVVVIGGGTGGAPAGIAAARQGAKTLVVEYLHGLGGVGTQGAIASYYWGNRVGFSKEVQEGKTSWQIEQRAEWWRTALRKAGAEIWFGALGCGAFVENGRVRGAIVATPEGRGVVLAKVVIDSTGNADIAAAAGAQCVTTDATDIALQGAGLPPRNLGTSYTNTDFTLMDDSDMLDVWHVFVYTRAMAGNAFDLGQLLDTRERRRIVGDFTLTILDEVNGRTQPDTICQAYSDFDTHGYTVDPYFTLAHPPHQKGLRTQIPYRCLLPKGLDGILVTGLGVSAHRDAIPVIRMQPDIQNQGYAAGVAAAMAAKTGVGTRQIDLSALQKHLVQVGNLTPSVLTDKDSYPFPTEKLAAAVEGLKDDLEGVSVLLTQPEQSMPLLRHAYEDARYEKDKLAYAQVLAVMGDPLGVPTLIKAVEAAPALDKGWQFTGMGQFGRNLSPLASLIYALGRARDRRATPCILAKLKLLTPQDAFSHYRAMGLALESIGDPSAAAPLAEVLQRPDVRGHAVPSVDKEIERAKKSPNFNATLPRSNALRELILARALFRCGDKDGLGRKILQEYAADLRGHFARHAQAVLEAVGR